MIKKKDSFRKINAEGHKESIMSERNYALISNFRFSITAVSLRVLVSNVLMSITTATKLEQGKWCPVAAQLVADGRACLPNLNI